MAPIRLPAPRTQSSSLAGGLGRLISRGIGCGYSPKSPDFPVSVPALSCHISLCLSSVVLCLSVV